ncbi:MAG: Gfo/Idh/MocA family oxidoreductase [Caldilineaceae bacterium SB0661_bin_32]|uniref:Gfo/Idh/MocA family oxidoreductase n=1 Tax=Caldilineaceae bacterium SB0661_bin_32 TaxID=2605255 RepID=A0A6B1D3F4_9CHLR|nr:Gfo/Idh/MocA family oxidoreductase [Caldilineaceae bacterium SB0661_bin_32]
MAFIGCGGMARSHTRRILKQQDTTEVKIVCEPSANSYEAFCELFEEAGRPPPPNEPDLEKLLQNGELDAAFIITPHVLHFSQAKACLEAGLDVLLEKPMVMNAEEALALIDVRDRSERLLSVSFNGSMSPQVRTGVQILRSGRLGRILNISAVVWQNWMSFTTGLWRQDPEVAGGGFLFDTGAHMLNTISDLAGEDFVEVAAWMDNHGTPVDILGAVIARLKSGALVSMNAAGNTQCKIGSDVRVLCEKGMLQTGVWGECLLIQETEDEALMEVKLPESLGTWQQFLRVRAGEMENPCPPEIGLRMARLWDAIKESAGQGGRPVTVGS